MKQEMEFSCETLKFYSPLVIMQEPLDEDGYPTNGDYEPIGPDFDILSILPHPLNGILAICGFTKGFATIKSEAAIFHHYL